MTSQTVQERGSARRHHTVRHRPCWSLQYAEHVSNMNPIYGLALHEFSVAQVDRGSHRFKSRRGLRFFLCPTLVTCWLIHFHICFTELTICHLSFFQYWELLASNIASVCTGLKWELVCDHFYLPSECTITQYFHLFFCFLPARYAGILFAPQGITDNRLEVSEKSSCLFKPVTRFFLLFCQVKPRAKGHNFPGQQLPTLLDDTCCVRFYALLHVVALAQSLKPVKLLSQQLPTFLLFRDRRSVAQQFWIRLRSSSNIVEVL